MSIHYKKYMQIIDLINVVAKWRRYAEFNCMRYGNSEIRKYELSVKDGKPCYLGKQKASDNEINSVPDDFLPYYKQAVVDLFDSIYDRANELMALEKQEVKEQAIIEIAKIEEELKNDR